MTNEQNATMVEDSHPVTRLLEGKWELTVYVNADGEIHRSDGPAVIDPLNREEKWYRHGKVHRSDGPAVVYEDGRKEWWVDGKLHRSDGPAMEPTDGLVSYWLDGKLVSEAEVMGNGPVPENFPDGFCYTNRWGKTTWLDADGKVHRTDGPAEIEPDAQRWFYHGVRHRSDGPAVEFQDGSVMWFHNGQLHREDGPAVEWTDCGGKAWYQNGLRHRSDGPAIECPNEEPSYWLNGVLVTEEEFRTGNIAQPRPESMSFVDERGEKRWIDSDGQLHCSDGPAAISRSGLKFYYIHGKPLTEQDVMG